MLEPLYAGVNDNDVAVLGLYDEQEEEYVNDATVTAQLYSADLTSGTPVRGSTFGSPITLTYVTASNGNYIGTLEGDFGIVVGSLYFLKINAVSDAGKGEWEGICECKRRSLSRR